MTCPNYEFAFIFYTTDGSKPTSRVSKTINTRTFKYKPEEGVLLRQGKRTIKAMCVLPDGRESNIVTKEFMVKWAPSESDEGISFEKSAPLPRENKPSNSYLESRFSIGYQSTTIAI